MFLLYQYHQHYIPFLASPYMSQSRPNLIPTTLVAFRGNCTAYANLPLVPTEYLNNSHYTPEDIISINWGPHAGFTAKILYISAIDEDTWYIKVGHYNPDTPECDNYQQLKIMTTTRIIRHNNSSENSSSHFTGYNSDKYSDPARWSEGSEIYHNPDHYYNSDYKEIN